MREVGYDCRSRRGQSDHACTMASTGSCAVSDHHSVQASTDVVAGSSNTLEAKPGAKVIVRYPSLP